MQIFFSLKFWGKQILGCLIASFLLRRYIITIVKHNMHIKYNIFDLQIFDHFYIHVCGCLQMLAEVLRCFQCLRISKCLHLYLQMFKFVYRYLQTLLIAFFMCWFCLYLWVSIHSLKWWTLFFGQQFYCENQIRINLSLVRSYFPQTTVFFAE